MLVCFGLFVSFCWFVLVFFYLFVGLFGSFCWFAWLFLFGLFGSFCWLVWIFFGLFGYFYLVCLDLFVGLLVCLDVFVGLF